ncbi:MAG: tandem-95 repeat protein [Kangiellaceae bacterium]|nr:tandem-95 repeat protein [Kangiellaceae bacterium]
MDQLVSATAVMNTPPTATDDLLDRTLPRELVVNQQANVNLNWSSTELAGGEIVVIWESSDQQQDTSLSGIKARIFDAVGNELVSEFLVNERTWSTQTTADVTALEGGGFIVTWTSDDGHDDTSSYGVKARAFDSRGNEVISEFLVNEATTHRQQLPAVSPLPGGGFVIVWESMDGQDDESVWGIKARIFDASRNEVASEFLVNEKMLSYQVEADVATLPNGNFVVTWQSYDGEDDTSQYGIKARIFDPLGNEIVPEFLVNERTYRTQRDPAISALAGGGFVISWYSDDGVDDTSEGAVKARIFDDLGNAVSSEFLANQSTEGLQTSPAVVGLAGGDFVVAWQTPDLSSTLRAGEVQARIFDAAGNETVAEFSVNERSLGYIRQPALTALSDGGFMASYSGPDATDLSERRVMMRQLNADGTAYNHLAMNENYAKTIGFDELLANDSDPDGDPLEVIGIDTGATQGVVTDNGDGTFTYDPAGAFEYLDVGEVGSDSFSYTLSDGVDTASANVTLIVNGVNDAPVAGPDNGVRISDDPVIIDVLANDTDVDGDPLRIVSVSDGAHGGATIDRRGTSDPGDDVVIYTPTPGYLGADTLSYALSDGTAVVTGTISVSLTQVFNGSDADEQVEGTAFGDWIDGAGGNDQIRSYGGEDTLFGGTGTDQIFGGEGADLIEGGDDNDLLFGGERWTRTTGNDTVFGNAGYDTLYGSDGADSLDGGAGYDKLNGGDEGDTATTDTIVGGDGNDILDSGQSQAPTYLTRMNGDILLGEAGNDTILGGMAEDSIEGGSGDDSIDGGAGDDRIWLGLATVATFGDDLGNGFAWGGDGDDAIYGSNGRNWISGDAGHDTITGGDDGATADRDTLFGGAGRDEISSGQVEAPINAVYQTHGDAMYGGEGDDTINGGLADDVIEGGRNDDMITGGGGNDMIWTGLSLVPQAGDDYGADTAEGGNGDDAIYGSNGRDLLFGDAGNDTLTGGDDLGTADADTLIGGSGHDVLLSGQVETPLNMNYQARGDELLGGSGNDTITGGAADDFIEGGRNDDVIDGAAGDDIIYTGLSGSFALGDDYGADTARGGEGSDQIFGSNGTDELHGEGGDDTITGGDDYTSADSDLLFGGSGNDVLISGQISTPTAASLANGDVLDGGAGNDDLTGGLAQDTLIGGDGNDTLTGGGAADDFVFSTTSGIDTVTDFTDGVDMIDLTAFGSGATVMFVQNETDTEMRIDDILYAIFSDISASAFDSADYELGIL